MTSLTRSSITGLYHPKRSLESTESSPTRTKISAVDRMLNADRSGFLSTNSLINSSRSTSTLDRSSSSSSLEQSLLEAQIQRVISCNETMEASIKRLRTEAQNSTEDLITKNEALERSLHEARIKISELDKGKNATMTTSDTVNPPLVSEQHINTLENDKLELKLQLQQYQYLHTKEVTQLEKTINDLKHQLIERENQFQLSQFDREKLNNLNCNISEQLNEKTVEIAQLQKRVIELELINSTLNPSNVINQTLADEIKLSHDIRYENERLKSEIELLKLKCNERTLHEEELRGLRQQVQTGDNYRVLIAKKDAELLKLREQLVKSS